MAILKHHECDELETFGFEYDIYLRLIFFFRISNEPISFKLFAYNFIKRRII